MKAYAVMAAGFVLLITLLQSASAQKDSLMVTQDYITMKYGFIDENGTIIIPAIYNTAYDFSEGYAYVETDEKTGFIDKTGTIKILVKFRQDY